jgi:hypothetical protein
MIRKPGGVFKESKERKSKKYDLFVVRINNAQKNTETKLVNSRPCSHCLDMMKAVGIRRVYYSDDSGDIIYENVKDMISIHTSKVAQKYDISNKKKYGELIDQKTINQTEYFDELIRKKIPNVIKEINYRYFIEYNFKIISSHYKLESTNKAGCLYVNIINSSDVVLKSLMVY